MRTPAPQIASSQLPLLRYLLPSALTRMLAGVLTAGVVVLQPGIAEARPLLSELQVLLSTSPALKASVEEANARRQEITASNADAEPLIQMTGESGFERTDLPSNDQYRNQVGLSITQNIYDGFGTHNRVLASTLNERAGHMDVETTQNTLLMEGIQSYINVVLQNRLVGISKRNVEIIEEITNFISRERAIGRMTLADQLQSRARLQQARETFISFEGSREQSIARYEALFGKSPDIARMQDPIAPIAFMPTTLDKALAHAIANNPIIEGAKLAADVANAQRMALGASALPKVDLIGSVDVQNDYDGASGTEEEGTLLVSLSWDLYDGNRTTATQMAATNRESAAIATLNQRERDVTEQTKMAWHAVFMDRKRTSALTEAESIALEAYDARYSLMITGKDTIINVLDTALEVLNVRTAKTTADYRYRLSVFRLLHAMGRLAPASISSIIITHPLNLETSNTIAPNSLEPSDLIAAPTSIASVTAAQPKSETESISATLSRMVAGMNDAGTVPEPPVDIMTMAAPVSAGQTAAVAPPMAVEDGFYVILSANRQEQNAIATMDKLSIQGSSILLVQIKGSPMYMVVVGPLAEPEARVVQGEAFGVGVLDAWLKKGSSL